MGKEKTEPHIFDFTDNRGFWGHHIEVSHADRKTGNISGSGHIGEMFPPQVKLGDILKIKGSEKGFIMTFEFVRVQYQTDPSDMFFFSAKFVKEEDPNEKNSDSSRAA